MVYQRRQIITESERNDIRSLYGLIHNKDFVFDLVVSENEKYVIIMDQVFTKESKGVSIGSIWENTYIFNELIKDSFKDLNESVQNDLLNVIHDIEWTKDSINEWLKEKTIITESWFDDLKSGTSSLVSKIGNGAVEIAKNIFTKGVIPALRWVRRGLYTGVGIVVDVIVSILAAKTNAIVWFVIVLLDIYEIGSGDFDPQDPQRMQLPFFFLFADLLGCVFTGAVAFGAKKAAPAIMKQGIQKVSPSLAKSAKTLGQKIPGLKSQLKTTAMGLEKGLGPKSKSIIGKITGFIDSILDELIKFLPKLFSKEGAKAGVTAGVVAGVGHAVGKGVEKLDKNGNVGQSIVSFNDKMKSVTNTGSIKVSDAEGIAILQMAQK
jgi:hypothetical protein